MTKGEARKRNRWRAESMEWFSGWMFGCACSMLVLLVGYIVYQGLATHWPRAVGLFHRHGSLVASEHSDSVAFGTVIEYPEDIWTIERKNEGTLHVFPIKLIHRKSPALVEDISMARVFLLWFEQATVLDRNRPEWSELMAQLQQDWKSLQSFYEQKVELPIDSFGLIASDVQTELAEISASMRSLETKLQRLDRQLLQERRLVRQAGRQDGLEIDRIYNEVLEAALEWGATERQRLDLLDSWQFWNQKLSNGQEPNEVMVSLRKQLDESLANEIETKSLVLEKLLSEKVKPLPLLTRDALLGLSETAKRIATEQIEWNTKLAEWERKKQGYQVVFARPTGLKTSETTESASHAKLIRIDDLDGFPRFCWGNSDTEDRASIPLPTDEMFADDIVRAFAPNQLTRFGKFRVYASRWSEFLLTYPRQAGMTGGVFPAIWGTIAMTLLMSVMVVPLGVMAAIYIHEYAEHGYLISFVRITINNLAGVPSIVYGVFGLAFFCYTIGGFVDGGPSRVGLAQSSQTMWWFTVALTLVLSVGLVLLIVWSPERQAKFGGSLRSWLMFVTFVLSLAGLVYLATTSPYFGGFYREDLPNPTFGKGCLLWASLTLALLTLPVVIVSTEEALAAVPHSLREGSYACGASKWQTIYRLVIPHARAGILTGFILSMARGAGEVAPLMLVGAIPLTTDLPVDSNAPFLHGSRAFMHLGFQIYSMGFQSQDSVAAKPIVFSTTLLLLAIVWTLNSAAIWMRARLRSRTQSSQF